MILPVTFFTKCWQRDYERVLGGGAVEQARRCGCDFTHKAVIVNNVDDRAAVERLAEAAVLRGDFVSYHFAEDYAQAALDHFKLTKEDLGRGYVYSICEMIEPIVAKTPYLLHFAGDVAVDPALSMRGALANWVERAISILETDPHVAVVNPVWNGRALEARIESTEDRGDHFVGFGFSDQAYLVRTADFKADILREEHPVGMRYPDYGGELFEKRVDAWMRNHERMRATLKNVSYRHPWTA